MKPTLFALAFAVLAAPVLAQAPGATQIEAKGRSLVNTWIALFNKGDAAGMAKDVYAGADQAALAAKFKELRADSFGKLEAYSVDFCGADAEHGKALLKFARIYTFGGKMNDDEAKTFDLVKTPGGWRISIETDVTFDAKLSCG